MPDFQFVEQLDLAVRVRHQVQDVGVDGISMLFVVLSALPDAALHPGELGIDRGCGCKEYMVAFLVLETLMIGVFCALDLHASSTSSSKAVLIPMFLIIGVWGAQPARLR
jgi:NADH-quinone oxidoreductase subunit M